MMPLVRVDHNVGLVECRNAGFEIERVDGWVNLQMMQGSIADRYGCELAQVVSNTSA